MVWYDKSAKIAFFIPKDFAVTIRRILCETMYGCSDDECLRK